MGTYSNHHEVWFGLVLLVVVVFIVVVGFFLVVFFYLETIPHIILQKYFTISKSLTIAKVYHSKVLLWREDLDCNLFCK